jgi:hypothetical protein
MLAGLQAGAGVLSSAAGGWHSLPALSGKLVCHRQQPGAASAHRGLAAWLERVDRDCTAQAWSGQASELRAVLVAVLYWS